MSKKNFVTLKKSKRNYKICTDDISAVYTALKKKRPTIPSYE